MAARTAMLHVRVDNETKEQATAALGAMGLSVSDAVRLCLRRVVADQAFPPKLEIAQRPVKPPHAPPTRGKPAKLARTFVRAGDYVHTLTPHRRADSPDPEDSIARGIVKELVRLHATAAYAAAVSVKTGIRAVGVRSVRYEPSIGEVHAVACILAFDDRCLGRTAGPSAKRWMVTDARACSNHSIGDGIRDLYSRKWRAVHCAQGKFETTMSSDEDNSSWKKLCRVRAVRGQNARDTSISLLF